MLRFLSVRHLAVIDQLEIEFEPGFNVLSGETGAGKSVLVDAVDLLLGGRASADLVRTGEELASVQAIFERPDGREVIVRREVSQQGRSRAFIDDALATSGALRELGAGLVDLHGQHEHQTLLDPAGHVDVLDVFAGHQGDADAVAAAFDAWRAATQALERTQLSAREKQARIDIASFQKQEIDRAAPARGEDEQLAAERAVLANADRLGRLSAEAYAALYEGEQAALATLGLVWRRVADLAALDPRLARYLDDRDDLKARLEDLAFFLRSYGADLEASPDRLQAAEDRLAALDRLKKKYGPALDDVLDRAEALGAELSALDASEARAAELDARARAARDAFARAAAGLSSRRQDAGRRLSRALEQALVELAMPHSRVDVRLEHEPEDRWNRRGVDRVELFLSPNPGEDLRPLARIASGGELSRIMLALRTLAASDEPGRTLVFDEVDAGIGGAAADAVARRLHGLGARYQVLCITHLPQIAARGDAHFQLVKQVRGGRTMTVVERLDPAGREAEIARMIAGAKVSAHVLASAREMLAKHGEETANATTAPRGRGRRRGA